MLWSRKCQSSFVFSLLSQRDLGSSQARCSGTPNQVNLRRHRLATLVSAPVLVSLSPRLPALVRSLSCTRFYVGHDLRNVFQTALVRPVSRFHRCGRWRMRLLTKPLLQLHQHFVGVRSGQDGKGTQAPADRPQDQSPGGYGTRKNSVGTPRPSSGRSINARPRVRSLRGFTRVQVRVE
ncbi:hypothetical protein EDB86DRAFT_1097577 [Lactarius hatsudake]|nr:hypothetical protein EDB86DRAFT_1097577 [Lactarius hatsudake]